MSEFSVPVIVVSHLPSAASFYAAITQPLGLRYLSASPDALHFGAVLDAGPACVFTLQQAVGAAAPPLCHITLLAQSPAAITSFYKKSLLANNAQTHHSFTESEAEIVARTRDLDGNMVDAVYSSRRRPAIETASTTREARRVLDWQHEVARSVAASEHSPSRSTASSSTATYREPRAGPATYGRADSFPPISHESKPLRLVKRETVTREHYRRPDDDHGGGGGGGFSGMKLVGTLLGAAAGAAVAYAMVQSESPRRYAPPPRRASYAGEHSTYSPVIERIPARSYVSRDADRPQYVAQYTVAAPSQARRIEERSHVSQRTGRSEKHSTRERSRSEVGPRYERPLTILPGPTSRSPQSHVSPRSHTSHRSDEMRNSYHGSRKDSESYVSARSQASKRTGDVKYVASAAPSRSSTTTVRVVPQDDRRSILSARNIPLPMSRVGGYAASVAPSDSVSSVGTKRERERLRDRMRERY
jgi:hypothetical protein